ncbi:MAG: 50S ribosome-binding GTPase, partial [Planctomycetes bacterium]|nr:50S ribosome-binding GTPase [Planctomycetota bacterium]
MALLETALFRNIAIVGHSGSGKTSLAEALLFKVGVTSRLGSVPDGTSMLDTSEESKEKGSSLDSAVAYLSHNKLHVNLLDTPGTAAF